MRLEYREVAKEQLKELPKDLRERIIKKLHFYASQREPLSFAKRLAGHGAYRFRIGNYRAIFDLDDDVLSILLIVKRESAYKDL